jgi:hypothetical protein
VAVVAEKLEALVVLLVVEVLVVDQINMELLAPVRLVKVIMVEKRQAHPMVAVAEAVLVQLVEQMLLAITELLVELEQILLLLDLQ